MMEIDAGWCNGNTQGAVNAANAVVESRDGEIGCGEILTSQSRVLNAAHSVLTHDNKSRGQGGST
jgi:V8-like Glu-specific endopeptidase